MDKQILYLDLETTINNRGEDAIGKNQASPFHPDNEIVWYGWKYNSSNLETRKVSQTTPYISPNPATVSILIGQNIGFDLLHLMKQHSNWYEWTRTGAIWDTMIAEYLLSGQQDKFIGLDDLSKRYGGTVKDSRIKEYWKAGVCTKHIPDDEIKPYLEQDVFNVEKIFKGQLAKAHELDMLPLLYSQMESRLATIMMEYYGMHFDKHRAYAEKQKLYKEYNIVEDKLKRWLGNELNCDPKLTNPNSNKQISSAIFGFPELNFIVKEVATDYNNKPILYKSGQKKGQIKYKNTTRTYKGIELVKPIGVKLGANGVYNVGDDVLKKKCKSIPVVNDILKLRELKKQISTYFDGYSALVFPDNCIHGSLNHCQTNTGRLSSSQPNLQNVNGKSSETK